MEFRVVPVCGLLTKGMRLASVTEACLCCACCCTARKERPDGNVV